MKICVVGAGAIGGLVAARLAAAGHEVTVVARGAHLAAMRERGLELRPEGGPAVRVHVNAAERIAERGGCDVIFIGLKAYSVGEWLPAIAASAGPQTPVVPLLNGIPWWYFHCERGPFEGQPIACVDPGGKMLRALDCARILGCVVYAAAEVIAPGVIRQLGDARLVIGEPDGTVSSRARAVARALEAAGFAAPVSSRIRDAVWTKLIGNLAFNPVCALTLARVDQAMSDPDIVDLMRAVMFEGIRVGEAYGVRFDVTVDERLRITSRRAGAGKVSMLQDLERGGRPIESEAIVGAVRELARRAGVDTPVIDVVLPLIRARGRLAAMQKQPA